MNDIRGVVDSASRAIGSDEKARSADHAAITKLVDSVSDICRTNNLTSKLITASFQVGAGGAKFYVDVDVASGADSVSPTATMINTLLKHIVLGTDGRVAVLNPVIYNDRSNSFNCKFNFPSSTVSAPNKRKAAIITNSKKSTRTSGPRTTITKRTSGTRAQRYVGNAILESVNDDDVQNEDGDGGDELSESTINAFTSGTKIGVQQVLEDSAAAILASARDSTTKQSKKWWNPLTWLPSKEDELTHEERAVVKAFEYKPNLFSGFIET